MKGIRKLFFGLILMTLIGVGFKVEAKAAALELEWDTTNYVLTGYINFETPTDFPDQVKKYTYRYSLTPSVTGASGSFIFESRDDGAGGLDYYYNDSIVNSNREELFSLTAEEVRNLIKKKSTTFTLKCTGNGPAITPDDVTIDAGLVTAAAYGKGGRESSKFDTKLVDPATVYLFAGEKGYFTSSNTITESNITYGFIKWDAGSGTISYTDGYSCELTMADPVENYTLMQIFGSLYTTESSVGVNSGSVTKAIKITNYGYNLPTDVAKVELDDGTDITADTTWTNTTVKIDTTNVTTPGLYDVIVTMADDTEYTFEDLLLVYGTGTVTLDPVIVTNGATISLGYFSNDDYVVVSPSVTSGASTYASLVTPSGTKYLAAWKVKGLKETSSGGVSGIKIGTDTTSVTVYPKPTASFGSSSGSLSSTSKSSSDSSLTVTMPTAVYHDGFTSDDIDGARIVIEAGGESHTEDVTGFTGSGMKQTKSFSRSTIESIVEDMLEDKDDDSYTVKISAYPMSSGAVDTQLAGTTSITAYKVTLDTSGGAKYTVNGSDKSGSFYVLDGTSITVKSSAARSGERFQSWDDSVFSSESGGTYKVLGAKRFKANYSNGSSSMNSSSTTGRNSGAAGEGMDDYDDVPKTGESKTDIWILWSVLFVSILGAGFMIWKRFGLVRAIAEADEEVAVAEHKEEVKAKKKEKEDKLKMLKDLRNL